MNPSLDDTAALRRRLNLPLLVLYGVGVTVGAGIYVLIGDVAEHAGLHAPLAFVLAAIVMGVTVGSYAELCTRYPVAAGEAAYVKAAFRSRMLSTITGLLMITSGIVSAAAVALGASGYIAEFVDLPQPILVAIVAAVLGLVSAWGILESVILASVFTLVEVGGLLVIIAAAAHARVPIGAAMLTLPSLDAGVWSGIAFASLLAFFAFTGFEGLANVSEEARAPERHIPIAMALTLMFTTLLYVLIAAIAVTILPVDRLAASTAPLSLLFHEMTGVSPATISVIAIVATLNTIIAQMTMVTRVLYGMSRQGDLPRMFGRVNHATGTPLVATAIMIAAVLACVWLAPLERLAEFTSMFTLGVFALVNLALLRLRLQGAKPRHGVLTVPIVIPVLGLLSCMVMIVAALI